MENTINRFYEKHKKYIDTVYKTVFYVMIITSFIEFLLLLVEAAFVDRNLAGVFMLFLFQGLIIFGRALLGTVLWGTVVAIALFPIHLIFGEKNSNSDVARS